MEENKKRSKWHKDECNCYILTTIFMGFGQHIWVNSIQCTEMVVFRTVNKVQSMGEEMRRNDQKV